jgi:hypothetical protein
MKNVGILIFLSLIVFSGCKKRREKNIQPAKDFALISNNIQTIVPLVSSLTLTGEKVRSALATGIDSANTCASFTLVSGDTLSVSNASPLVFDIDFSSGCLDNDGWDKSGVIRCTLYGFMNNTGANCSCSFVDFEINGNTLSGGIAITNTGALSLLITTSNLRLKVGKKHIYIDTDIRSTQLSGYLTPNNWLDNSYLISSIATLTDRYSVEFDVFAEELYKHYSCKWIASGFAELNDKDNKPQVIDFGTNSCDSEATISIEEKVYTIELE